jgi:hypothetical protein
MDLPTTQAYLGRSDRAQVARRIAAGAADTILYRDCDAIYVQRDPTWQPEPIVPSATHPSVAGFEDWAVTAHPEGFDDDVDDASDQVCSFTSGAVSRLKERLACWLGNGVSRTTGLCSGLDQRRGPVQDGSGRIYVGCHAVRQHPGRPQCALLLSDTYIADSDPGAGGPSCRCTSSGRKATE